MLMHMGSLNSKDCHERKPQQKRLCEDGILHSDRGGRIHRKSWTNSTCEGAAVANAVNNTASPSTSHGVKATIATTKYYRNGNHVPYRTVKQITGASLY